MRSSDWSSDVCASDLATSLIGQITGEFAFCSYMSLTDTGAGNYQLIGRINNGFKLGIGHDALGQIAARANYSGILHRGSLRSEERRVRTECGRPCRSRASP